MNLPNHIVLVTSKNFVSGDDRLAHTDQERIAITELKTATETYEPMICAVAKALRDYFISLTKSAGSLAPK